MLCVIVLCHTVEVNSGCICGYWCCRV